VVAARIELMLIDGVEVAELKMEDVLIVSYPLSGKTPSRAFKALTTSWARGDKDRLWRNEGEVEPPGVHLSSFVELELDY
jgi:hypothetical protein